MSDHVDRASSAEACTSAVKRSASTFGSFHKSGNKKIKATDVRSDLAALISDKRSVAERQIMLLEAKDKREAAMHELLVEEKKLQIEEKKLDIQIKAAKLAVLVLYQTLD